MKKLPKICSYSVIILSLIVATNCGGSSGSSSGSSNDAGTGTGNAINDTLTTFNTVAEVISTSLNVSTSAGSFETEQHVHCSNGEQATVTGSIDFTAKTFALNSSFNSCEGVNNSTSFSGSYEGSGDNFNFAVSFSGNAAGNGCTLTLNSLTYNFTVSQTTITAPGTESAKGSMTATCTETAGTATVTCDLGSGVQSNNTTLMTAACSCQGAGCG